MNLKKVRSPKIIKSSEIFSILQLTEPKSLWLKVFCLHFQFIVRSLQQQKIIKIFHCQPNWQLVAGEMKSVTSLNL